MRWTLQSYLDRHGLEPQQLVKASGLPNEVILAITSGEAQQVSLAFLETLLTSLRTLTGERVALNDLLEPDDPSAGGAPWEVLAGLFDAPGSAVDGAINHDRYLDAALVEEHEQGPRQG